MKAAARVGLLCAISATAHDLYLMTDKWTPASGSEISVRFEDGEGFPAGQRAIDPKRLLDAEVLWSSGQTSLRQLRQVDRHTTAVAAMPSGNATVIITGHIEPAVIETDAQKFSAYLHAKNLTDAIAVRKEKSENGKPGREMSSQYVKAILRVGKGDREWNRQTGQTIEFVAEADPYALAPGGTLPVRVYFQGAPAADVPVELAFLEGGSGKTLQVGATDGQGRVRVPITVRGPYRLQTIKMERAENSKQADWLSYSASLTFEVQ